MAQPLPLGLPLPLPTPQDAPALAPAGLPPTTPAAPVNLPPAVPGGWTLPQIDAPSAGVPIASPPVPQVPIALPGAAPTPSTGLVQFSQADLASLIQQAIAAGARDALSNPLRAVPQEKPVEWSVNELIHNLVNLTRWHSESQTIAAKSAVDKWFPVEDTPTLAVPTPTPVTAAPTLSAFATPTAAGQTQSTTYATPGSVHTASDGRRYMLTADGQWLPVGGA